MDELMGTHRRLLITRARNIIQKNGWLKNEGMMILYIYIYRYIVGGR